MILGIIHFTPQSLRMYWEKKTGEISHQLNKHLWCQVPVVLHKHPQVLQPPLLNEIPGTDEYS